MKIVITTFLLIFSIGLPPLYSQAQELQQLALNIEKLTQFRQILKDMKAGYQILSKGYGTIKDLSEGNFNLHQTFLDALLQVSPTVRNYRRVADIAQAQVALVNESRRALERWQGSGQFTGSELGYFEGVYGRLLDASLRNLDELLTIMTSGEVRMSDAERLAAIDAIYADLEDKLLFLREFNNTTSILALQRGKDQGDVDRMRALNATNP